MHRIKKPKTKKVTKGYHKKNKSSKKGKSEKKETTKQQKNPWSVDSFGSSKPHQGAIGPPIRPMTKSSITTPRKRSKVEPDMALRGSPPSRSPRGSPPPPSSPSGRGRGRGRGGRKVCVCFGNGPSDPRRAGLVVPETDTCEVDKRPAEADGKVKKASLKVRQHLQQGKSENRFAPASYLYEQKQTRVRNAHLPIGKC